MIALIGDIHGQFDWLAKVVSGIPLEAHLIQVGDFGYWPENKRAWQAFYVDLIGRDIKFVDGNHDHVQLVKACAWQHAYYMPRGIVEVIDGRRVLFLGGAKSLDRASRPHNHGVHAWFDEEQVTYKQIELAADQARRAGGVDLMVTHTPPDWMIREHFSRNGLRYFGHDPDTWVDESAKLVEALWLELGEPKLICGHMHKSVADGNCHILSINEVMYV